MQCAKCGLAYDVNDPDPSECSARKLGLHPALGEGYNQPVSNEKLALFFEQRWRYMLNKPSTMSNAEFDRLYEQRPELVAHKSTEARKNLKEMFDNSE